MNSIDPIYLDIETIPTQEQRVLLALRDKAQAELNEKLLEVKAPANYKDADKIEKYIEEARARMQAEAVADLDKAIHATGLDGAFCQVAVCSIADGDGEPDAIYDADWQHPQAERNVLHEINGRLESLCTHQRGRLLIGHNILGFDRKVLRQRGIVHGIRMHWLITKEVKPWDMGMVFDTMVAWSGDPRDKASMDKLCLAFNIPSKGDIDGSKVWQYVQEGRIGEVADYCNGDVERTRAIYKRLMYLGAPVAQPVTEDLPF